MAKTAVGLFRDPGSADNVVRDLEASGFPRGEIRVIGEPREMSGNGATSIPRTDFEVDLNRELRTMGAGDADAAFCVEGLRRGGVMVFASGSNEKTEIAATVMNRHFALEVEQLNAADPHLPETDHESMAPTHAGSVQTGRLRSPGAGARLFVW